MGLLQFAHRFLLRQTMPASAVRYYDRLISPIETIYLAPFVDRVASACPGPTRLLDVGTGCGHLPVLLAKANSTWNVTGLDLSGPAVALARARAEAEGLGARVEFFRGSIDHPELPPANFDLVLSTCALHHWRHPTRILSASRRLLRPGGEIWVIDDRGGAPRKDRREWVRAVEAAHDRRLLLFRAVYLMESRFLAYTRREVSKLASRAGLSLIDHTPEGVFFVAKLVPNGARCRSKSDEVGGKTCATS